MKIIISAGPTGLKREIEGPFRICGSCEDLVKLRDELNRELCRGDRPFCYGWIDIIDERPHPGQPNTRPEPWE